LAEGDLRAYLPRLKDLALIRHITSRIVLKHLQFGSPVSTETKPDLVVGIMTVAAALRIEKVRRQEEERRRAEEQRRREGLARIQAEEEKRQAALELEVDLWTTSKNILAFLEGCEEAITERVGPVEPDGREAKWLLWART